MVLILSEKIRMYKYKIITFNIQKTNLYHPIN